MQKQMDTLFNGSVAVSQKAQAAGEHVPSVVEMHCASGGGSGTQHHSPTAEEAGKLLQPRAAVTGVTQGFQGALVAAGGA